jgi:hypothetical protein
MGEVEAGLESNCVSSDLGAEVGWVGLFGINFVRLKR